MKIYQTQKEKEIKRDIVAKARLTKAEVKDYVWFWKHIKDTLRFVELFKSNKKLLLNNAGAEFQDSRFKLKGVSESVQTAHRLVREHCAKIYFRAYKKSSEGGVK